MKIFTFVVFLLFFTINPVSAQSVRLPSHKNPVKITGFKETSTSTLTLTAIIDGFYNGSIMIPDTVTVELRDPVFTSLVIDSQRGVLNSAGVGIFNSTNAVNGSSYFILVKHRNTIETWSATTHAFTSSILSYDFTTAATQAYGSNMTLKGGKYCLYNGDVNHDEVVDIYDLSATANDNSIFASGYLDTDVNGDGTIDLFDLSIVDNNNNSFVSSVAPPGTTPTVNYEGITYHVILIGTQFWLKENLNVGTMITGDQNQTNNGIIDKYCYDNDTANCTLYGGLYQWNETMQYDSTERVKGICPPGWHIPTINEFSTLDTAVSSDGNALKGIDQGIGNGIGTNTSGFSALLSGYRLDFGPFLAQSNFTAFWSSTLVTTDYGRIPGYQYLIDYNGSITQDITSKDYGFSVRCVKN
jgi:uncharacterized protein (TIGR02145 family)